MFKIIKKEEVHTSNHGWLSSRFLFSFAEYFDPGNLSFGVIRVFNDDLIAPFSGFPPHSHKEMEIVTIMHRGSLTHADSMGNERTISPYYVQRMSAGTGVTHSEINQGKEEVHLYQIWFYPNKSGVTPGYEEKKFSPKQGESLLVSPSGEGDSLAIDANASISIVELKEGEKMQIRSAYEGEHILIYVKEGDFAVSDESHKGILLQEMDQLRFAHEEGFELTAKTKGVFFMLRTASA